MIGKTVSHYKILEKHGEGGMGVVYKAEDLKLKRTVALKFLPPELTRDPEAKEHFIQEAQAASALQHNNNCTIHDIDETPDGQLFIVMACYEGETLKQKIEHGPLRLEAAIIEILHILQQNADKINEHGSRADSIAKNMLQHSRGKAGEHQSTDINAMLEEDINLAYHGMRVQDSSFNIKIETDFDRSIGKLDVVPQDINRVFLNIINNGCYEAHRKMLEQNGSFSPTLSVRTRNLKDQVEIRIRDKVNGIPEAVREKLFTPFFINKYSISY